MTWNWNRSAVHLNDCVDCLSVLEDEERFRVILRQVHEQDCVAPENLRNKIENWVEYQETARREGLREDEEDRRYQRSMRWNSSVRFFSMAALVAVVVLVISLIPQKLPSSSSQGVQRKRMKEASAGVLDPSSATRNIVKSSRGKTSPIIKDPVARSVSEQVQRVERIQTADGPGARLHLLPKREDLPGHSNEG